MNNIKIFLCVAIILTIYQRARSFSRTRVIINGHNGNFTKYTITDEIDRIAGGTYAEHGEFPFMAVVHQLLGAGRILKCGGTIISKRWVLTAGHCIGLTPHKFLVVFGIINKQDIGYDYYKGSGMSMIAWQTVLHPQYSETVNDIGLLHMPSDIPFSRTIQPVRLADYNYGTQSFDKQISYVIGWGKDSNTSYGTRNLKFVALPVISNYECSLYWNISDKHICTETEFGEAACQGDSGGPLVVKENGKNLQIGIVSYGDGVCPSNRPGVFTRVSSFINWIQSVTQL